jgi:hypothetical protein
MDEPTFRMRAKVASRAGGHVFEERFMKLEGVQLFLAYRQAIKEEEAQDNLIKVLNETWTTRFNNFFKVLYMMVDGEKWAAVEEMKKIAELREEIKPEEFPDLWAEIEQIIPSGIIVEEPEEDPLGNLPAIDPEIDEFLTGFRPYKLKREGE